jgi:hypothetical protein
MVQGREEVLPCEKSCIAFKMALSVEEPKSLHEFTRFTALHQDIPL